jgi:hypothetical protein
MHATKSATPKQEAYAGIHELLARRWSPRAFAPRPVEPEKFTQLFEVFLACQVVRFS